MLAALAAPGRTAVAATIATAQAVPISSRMRPRLLLRRFGWAGTFMCVLPPRERWRGFRAASHDPARVHGGQR
jgi:hypothetical protein